MAFVSTASNPPAVVHAGDAPTVLDVEASGFGRGSYPIEVGFVLPDGSSRCTLIAPAPHWTHWDPAAEGLHHVRRESLLQHGRPIGEVARDLNDWLRGRTVYSDGWAQDYVWLATLFEEAHLLPSFRLQSLRMLLSEAEADRWHLTKQQVASVTPLLRHRASADARLLQMTFMRLRDSGPTSGSPPVSAASAASS